MLLTNGDQVAQHVTDALVPFVARFGERAIDDGNHLPRQRRIDAIERLRNLLQNLVERGGKRIALEGLAPAEHLVDDDAGREDVGPVIRALAADLFGRHVVDGAHHHVAVRQLRRHEPRQPEVEQLYAPVIGDEDIRGLDVAMDHVVRVRELEPLADLDRQIELVCQAQPIVAGHPALEILAVEILHREVGEALVLTEIVNGDDVAVGKLPGGARLAEEPLAEIRVLVDRSRDELDRDDALQQGVVGAVDHAHAPLAKLVTQFVAADAFHQDGSSGKIARGSVYPGGEPPISPEDLNDNAEAPRPS